VDSAGRVESDRLVRPLCCAARAAIVPAVPDSFAALKLSPALLGVVAELGYTTPTAIQLASIPPLLAGRDLIGQSMTGSGKTAAFGLPCLQRLDLTERVVQVLVLCPTRELSAQVARELRKLGRAHAGLTVLELVGGQPAKPQREALQRGVHVAVGTPGRVQDLLDRRALDVRAVRTVVLDEADRMLDMGFGEDVGRILRALPARRQTALFSATFPPTIEALCAPFQHGAVRVTIEEPAVAPPEVEQRLLLTTPERRLHALAWTLHRYTPESALVFCNFKASVAELTQALVARGAAADRLDGDLDQFHRDQVLARFRNRSVCVLVATDVAGRGIDVEGLDLVVNYELPAQPEAYVHRIGRTGRAGRAGAAVTFASDRHDPRVEAIERTLGRRLEPLTQDGDGPDPRALLAGKAPMTTILISGGRRDRVRPGDILGALTGEAGGLAGTEVGRIEVHETLSYVGVARAVGRRAVERLNAGRIKGKRFRATLVGDRGTAHEGG
jgi:ATP-independent RNA helicase DbpA